VCRRRRRLAGHIDFQEFLALVHHADLHPGICRRCERAPRMKRCAVEGWIIVAAWWLQRARLMPKRHS
jgi:hypothetical protein